MKIKIQRKDGPGTKYGFLNMETGLPVRKLSRHMLHGISSEEEARNILIKGGYEIYTPVSTGWQFNRVVPVSMEGTAGYLHYGEYGAAGMELPAESISVVSITDQKIIANTWGIEREFIISYSNDKYLVGIMSYTDSTANVWGYYDKAAQKFYITSMSYYGLPDMMKGDAYGDITNDVVPLIEQLSGVTAAELISAMWASMGFIYDASKITNIRVYGPTVTEHNNIINQYENLFNANGGQGWNSILTEYLFPVNPTEIEEKLMVAEISFFVSKVICDYDGVETNVSMGMMMMM